MSVRILIVDDNRASLKQYVKSLLRDIDTQETGLPRKKDHLEIETVDNVPQAIDYLQTKQYEILVVDLKIPGLSGEEYGGLDIIHESLALDPLRPIIAITGYGSIELARKTLTRGVFDFIEKTDTAIDELTQSVQRAIDSRNDQITRYGNPFTPMPGDEPLFFGGRTEELQFFDLRVNRVLHSKSREHFLVLGSWGIGKSALLKEFKKKCQNRGHIAVTIPLESLQSGTKQIEAVQSIVAGIIRDLPYPVNQFKKFSQYLQSMGINVIGTGFQFSRKLEENLSPQSFLFDSLMNLWQDVEKKKDGVFVILLDDFDNFMEVPELAMTLRATLSMDSIRKTKILFGIALTPDCWSKLTSIQQHHPLARYFLSRVELSRLNEDELRETIHKSLLGSGVIFTPEIVDRVFEYTQGHPFEMQVLCYNLFDNQLSRRVDSAIWDKAFEGTLRDLGIAVYDLWYDQASQEELKVLQAIAQSPDPVSIKNIQGMLQNSPKTGNLSKYLQRLFDKGLISKVERGKYLIPDRIFRHYIINHAGQKRQ